VCDFGIVIPPLPSVEVSTNPDRLHIPADLIERQIAEQPRKIRGLTVRGVPAGSLSMEGPNPVEYMVLSYGTEGKMTMYAAC
jgi:hypothetical protein